MEYKKRIFRPGTSTNIQRYFTFWNRLVAICTLGNRFYEQVLVFLQTVFVNENSGSACEDFSEFSDEELLNFSALILTTLPLRKTLAMTKMQSRTSSLYLKTQP